jgi:hypothetical protein
VLHYKIIIIFTPDWSEHLKRKIIFLAIIFFALALTSCSLFNDEPLNGAKLRDLVNRALKGEQDANVELKGLLDKDHIGRRDFNSLRIDSGYIHNKYYYSVLLEYFDPLLNIFAVYDDQLRFYLLDRSLNGNLSVQWAPNDKRNFIFVQEKFLTKDVLSIDRLSIYEIYDTSAGLIYRSLSRFVKDKDTSYQIIESITNNSIKTKMTGKRNLLLLNPTDTFEFDANTKKYISRRNYFNNFVKQEIRDFRWVTTKPQIASDLFSENNLTYGEGFQISLTDEWQKISPYTEENLLKKNLSGIKYFNKGLNASIIILALPEGQNAENYSSQNLSQNVGGKYSIRSTTRFTRGNNYNQVIEHSCENKKFLFLLDCPKNNYDRNKRLFDDIINSFFIDC